MILSFKPQFPTKICRGEKIHTIREDKTDRWMSGKIIHFCTGVRTKNYRKFSIGVCYSVQRIRIIHSKGWWACSIFIEDFNGEVRELTYEQMEILARNDGFDSLTDFMKWFSEDFTGKIIHWTDFRY